MLNVPNITVSEFFNLSSDEFQEHYSVLQFQVAKPLLCGKQVKSLEDFSFGKVREVQKLIKQNTFQNIVKCLINIFRIKENQVLKTSVKDFFSAWNWLTKELEKIEIKEKLLVSKPDNKLKEAGVDRLNVLGDFNTLVLVGEKYATPPNEVENWSYRIVYLIVLQDKISKEVNKDYQRLISKKNVS